jgi:two-component system NtrC family sensor kinase
VAHEVNNPLAVIREQAGWIRDLLEEEDIQSSPNFQELRDAVIKIEQHVERAGSVVHRMLGFARRMEPVRFDVSIKDLLRETVVFLENEMHFRNIQLKWDIEEDLPLVETDPSQLQQVILNIVDNAIDAIGKNGTITLGAAYDAQSGCVCMRIRDDGPGMDKDVQARVFDPFFTTKQVGEGTGLGLSISYSIVTRLGGTIRFVSQPGEGTEFIICLPVRRGSKADDRHLGEK